MIQQVVIINLGQSNCNGVGTVLGTKVGNQRQGSFVDDRGSLVLVGDSQDRAVVGKSVEVSEDVEDFRPSQNT